MNALARFFLVVPVVPIRLVRTALIVSTLAGLTVFFDVLPLYGALSAVLLLHAFMSSSGFLSSARRGHYDLLFCAGHSGWTIGVAHWLASSAPGLMCGGIVAAAGMFGRDPRDADAAAMGTWVAFFLVSSLSWSATAILPRFSGALAWLVMTMWAGIVNLGTLWGDPRSTGGPDLVLGVAWMLVYPPGIVAQPWSRLDYRQVEWAVLIGAGAVAAACAWIQRADIPLEGVQ